MAGKRKGKELLAPYVLIDSAVGIALIISPSTVHTPLPAPRLHFYPPVILIPLPARYFPALSSQNPLSLIPRLLTNRGSCVNGVRFIPHPPSDPP